MDLVEWARFEPAESGYHLGYGLVYAGDLDGDGWPDLAGLHPGDPYVPDALVTLAGAADGLEPLWTVAPSGPYGQVGDAIAGGGDVDGDGYADLLVAGNETVVWYRGAGRDGGLTGEELLRGDRWDAGLAVGDLDGDRYADLVAAGVSEGRVQVWLGSAEGPIDHELLAAPDGATEFGEGLAIVHLTGTRHGQVVVPANLDATAVLFVYDADSAGIETLPTWTAVPDPDPGNFDRAGDAGDVDGDGFGDVWARSDRELFLWFGSAAGPERPVRRSLFEGVGCEREQLHVAAGDLDVDGFGDLVATCVEVSSGRLELWFGSADGLATSAWRRDGPSMEEFGDGLAVIPDLDGDGRPEVAVGAPAWDGDVGRVYLYDLYIDEDGDGHDAVEDCDDADPTVFPGATERCAPPGVDEDCDGAIDETPAEGEATWYTDADGDGFGDPAHPSTACVAPEGSVADGTDCDDADPGAFPGAEELAADGVDQDCDGTEACPADADGDGYGGTGTEASAALDCVAAGVSPTADDCEDRDPARHPGATEVPGDGVDQDCDGLDAALPGVETEPDGCGCAGAGAIPGAGGVVLAALLSRRRRERRTGPRVS